MGQMKEAFEISSCAWPAPRDYWGQKSSMEVWINYSLFKKTLEIIYDFCGFLTLKANFLKSVASKNLSAMNLKN